MIEKIAMSQKVFENLLENFVKFEESYHNIIDEYFPDYNQERENFYELLTGYINKLNKSLEYITFQEESENNFPFVVIGSIVEVEDLDCNETFKYKIVAPAERNIENDCVSFLSPVGMALLSKEKNEIVVVNTPNGIYRYRIKSIILS